MLKLLKTIARIIEIIKFRFLFLFTLRIEATVADNQQQRRKTKKHKK